MISRLASEDLQDLRAEGLLPTDEDVIRLHVLGCRVSDGQDTTAANAPRWAFAGSTVFWEPTVGALEWYKFAKSLAADDDTEDWLFAFACAHGRKRGFFAALCDRESVERSLGQWLFSLNATRAEVERAVAYVAGANDVKPTKTPATKDAESRARGNFDAVEDMIRSAAAELGMPMDDILVQPPSRLRGMIYAAHVQAGMELTRSSAKAHAEYLATLAEIAARLRRERDETAAPEKKE